MTRGLIIAAASAAFALAACSGESSDAAPAADAKVETVDPAMKEVIETRQKSLKDLAKNFKAIADQVKSSAPDMAVVGPAAEKVAAYSQDIENWFPEGSGPSAGVKTEALDKIWEDPEGFAEVIAGFKTNAAALNAAVEAGDTEAMAAAFKATGGSCGTCHDTYRLDD